MTRWLFVSLAATLAALGASGYVRLFAYDQLPALVPTHWNIHGQPDAWTSKDNLFLVFCALPALMAGLMLLTVVLPWVSPRPFEVERFRGTLGYVMAMTVVLFGYLHAIILWSYLQPELPFTRLLIGGFFLFFALIGNVLGRVRRNFWVGVRTPWTLASEAVWNQTHRVTAWWFVALGVVGFVAVLGGVPPAWCFAGLIAVAIASVLYSLILYKKLERQGRL